MSQPVAGSAQRNQIFRRIRAASASVHQVMDFHSRQRAAPLAAPSVPFQYFNAQFSIGTVPYKDLSFQRQHQKQQRRLDTRKTMYVKQKELRFCGM